MSKAAVALDDWKLPIFKRHLDAAGYKYEEPVPFVDGTLILTVYYEWVRDLKPIIEAAAYSSMVKRRTEIPVRRAASALSPCA